MALAGYIKYRISYEMDRSSSDAVAFQMQEEMDLRMQYISLLSKLALCKVNNHKANQFFLIDKELNAVYKKIQKGENVWLSIDVKGVKKTQIAWIKYKMIWEKLSALKCPHLNKLTWSTYLTEQRLEQLEEIRSIQDDS